MTRRGLLRTGIPGAAAGLIALAGCGSKAALEPVRETGVFPGRVGVGDGAIVAFLLICEYLQADLYEQAIGAGVIHGAALTLAHAFSEQEQEHIGMLTDILHATGGAAPDRPRTHFPVEEPQAILALGAHVENVVAGAYLGQVARVREPETRATLVAISSVEARHAAALDLQVGGRVSSLPIARPWTAPRVLDELRPYATVR